MFYFCFYTFSQLYARYDITKQYQQGAVMIKPMGEQYSALGLVSGSIIWTKYIFTDEGKIHMAAAKQTANILNL